MIRRSTIACAFAAVALLAASLGAQDRAATVPVAVVNSIFWITPFGNSRFYAGELPPGWPAELSVPGARVLGGSTIGALRGVMARSGAFALPEGTDARAALARAIAAAGYSPRAATSRPRGGFVGSSGGPETYCKGTNALLADRADSTDASIVAIVALDAEWGAALCMTLPPDAQHSVVPRDIPALTPPPGATWRGGGSSWGGASGSTETTLRTSMPADAIVAHYAAQLRQAGWTPTGRPAAVDGTALQRFAFRRADGEWRATLIVVTVDDHVEAELRMIRKP